MVVLWWFLYVFNQVVSRPGAISTLTQAHYKRRFIESAVISSAKDDNAL